jgi:hypothetical protein
MPFPVPSDARTFLSEELVNFQPASLTQFQEPPGGFRGPAVSPRFIRPAWVKDILASDLAAPGMDHRPDQQGLLGLSSGARTWSRPPSGNQGVDWKARKRANAAGRGQGGASKRAKYEGHASRKEQTEARQGGNTQSGRRTGGESAALAKKPVEEKRGFAVASLSADGRKDDVQQEERRSGSRGGGGAKVSECPVKIEKLEGGSTRQGGEGNGAAGSVKASRSEQYKGEGPGTPLAGDLHSRGAEDISQSDGRAASEHPRSPPGFRGSGFRQLSAPLQRHRDSPAPQRSSPFADAIKQRVQQWQSTQAGGVHTSPVEASLAKLPPQKRLPSPTVQGSGPKRLRVMELGSKGSPRESPTGVGTPRTSRNSAERSADYDARRLVQKRLSVTPPPLRAATATSSHPEESPLDSISQFLSEIKERLSPLPQSSPSEDAPGSQVSGRPHSTSSTERLARLKERLSVTPPPPEKSPSEGARAPQPQTPAANTRLAQIKERLSFPTPVQKPLERGLPDPSRASVAGADSSPRLAVKPEVANSRGSDQEERVLIVQVEPGAQPASSMPTLAERPPSRCGGMVTASGGNGGGVESTRSSDGVNGGNIGVNGSTGGPKGGTGGAGGGTAVLGGLSALAQGQPGGVATQQKEQSPKDKQVWKVPEKLQELLDQGGSGL